jgi:hypothetical protein
MVTDEMPRREYPDFERSASERRPGCRGMQAARFGYEAGNATMAILRQNLLNHNLIRSFER